MEKIVQFCLVVLLVIASHSITFSNPVPDTGQTECYDLMGKEIDCPPPGDPLAQDGSYNHPISYTKLGHGGEELPDDETEWLMVRDNVTGLIWEVKQNLDGAPNYANPNDADNLYTWYDANPETNGGDPGTQGDGVNTFDTEMFIRSLNEKKFGGFSDWRLPSVRELDSIVDLGGFNPAIQSTYFPNTDLNEPPYYWSSNNSHYTDSAFLMSFRSGGDQAYYKSAGYYVRAVRSEADQSVSAGFVDNEDGTVTDSLTGLMWRQVASSETMTWSEALSHCEKMSHADYDDWRLPDRKELESILDPSRYDPTINPAYFPDNLSEYFWSATTYTYHANEAWSISFYDGDDAPLNKQDSLYARAVRSGQNRLTGHLFITSPRQATRWTVGSRMAIAWEEMQNVTGNVDIAISRAGGKPGTFEAIAENVPNDGLFIWTAAGPGAINCAIRIVPRDDSSKYTTQGLFIIGEISVSPLSLKITEPDIHNKFNIRMNAPPVVPVAIPLYASDPEQCRLSAPSVTFTESNWRTGVDVTVTAVDDDIHDGAKTVFIRTGPAESGDPAFSDIDPPDVEVEILDDDLQTLSIASVEPNVGALGQDLDVTIYGAGFDEGTTVELTGMGVNDVYSSSEFVFHDDSRISLTLRSPPDIGNYTLTVINDAERYSLESAVAFEDPQPIEALSGKKAIVVAGGVASPLENALWSATRACADKAYMELHHQGYAPEQVRYLSPETFIDLTGDGVNDRYDDASVDNLENAISNWAGGDAETREVLIYLTDHGREGAFGITGSDWLAAETLDGWLDALQTGRDIRIIVIYDACRSGSFIFKLKPPEGKERYVIASTRADAEAYFAHEGRLSFSHFFWDSVHREGGLFRAFRAGQTKISPLDQTPLIDLNGDGVGDAVTEDHILADIPVGIGKVAASELIEIGRVGGDAVVGCNNTGTLWADEIVIPNTMETIWADISPPPDDADPDTPVTDLHQVRLSGPDQGGRYTGEHRDFRKNGTYTIIFAARDKAGKESTHATARVFRSCDLMPVPCDLNADEKVTLADGLIAIQVLSGLAPRTFRADYRDAGVDVTGNAVVDMGEAIFAFQKAAGTRD